MCVSASANCSRILNASRTSRFHLNLQHTYVVFVLCIPALVLFARAQTAERSPRGPTPQVGPTQPSPQIDGARRPGVPPPMFSRAYVDALQGILQLEAPDVAALKRRLVQNPADFVARLKLIAYCMRADRVGLQESGREKAELVLWLIEHQPESEILGSPYGVLSPGDLTPDQLERAKRLWESAANPRQSDARIPWNAANFYQQFDRGLYVASLERAVALAPGNENYARTLGLLYASAILAANPQSMYRDPAGADPDFAGRAKHVLDTTQNVYLLEPAVRLLQSEYNKSLMIGKENASVGVLARQYFGRAKTLDPDLDEVWIHPQIDPKMIGLLAPGARPPDDARLQVAILENGFQRLPPEAFPKLPVPIASILRGRRCVIPQPVILQAGADTALRNVIRGEFFEKGQTAWAVLCWGGGSSSILAFRNDRDAHPEELARSSDDIYLEDLGGGRISYGREISAVNQKFIMDHYRAYGGPEPPPVDHQGIDDAFVGKASITHYWYRGEWRRLTGSD